MKSTGNILLADDEPTFLNATADLLREEGYECEAVSDGESCVKTDRIAHRTHLR